MLIKSANNLKQDKGVEKLRMSVVKPLSAHWMIKMFDYLKARPNIIVNGFSNVGIFSVMV